MLSVHALIVLAALSASPARRPLPPKGCRSHQVARMRAATNVHLERRRYRRARVLLERLVDRCEPSLTRFQRIWIRNDLALVQHYTGNDSACLRTLMPLRRYVEESPEQLGRGQPEMVDAYRHIADATRANLELCGAPGSVSTR